MKKILQYLHEHNTLSENEAEQILVDISESKYNETQVAAFISAFQMRSISVDELSGFKNGLVKLAKPTGIDPIGKIDMCGTGGDGKNTFNISTLSSVVAAAAGLKVTKHGNYGVSSACGSSNVLEALGYKFTNDPTVLKQQLDECNICFLHAPLFHPAMKFVGPIRKHLAIKTFFNMLGPMVNPVQPEYQSVGVFNLKLQRLYNYIFQKSERKYSVIYDLNGYDEISLTGISKIISHKGEHLIHPRDFGLQEIIPTSIHGGDTIEEAKNIFLDVLSNTCPESHKNVVCANVAIAMQLYSPDIELDELFLIAKETIESGKAKTNFEALLKMNS